MSPTAMSLWLMAMLALTSTPDRQIRFTTDEGTWMSVDVSPDGKRIVFDLLGDIYSVPISGGPAKPLLTGMAFESQPRYSPDGKWLAFVSDRGGSTDLWVSRADGGEARQLSREADALVFSPAWLPDGKSVVVSVATPARQGSAELWRYPLDGSNAEKIRAAPLVPAVLVSEPPAGVFGAAPSGDWIYFSFVTPRVYNSRSGSRADVFRKNGKTGVEEPVVTRADSAFRPAVSPDGKWLVYASHRDEKTALRVRELATGEERWIGPTVDRDELEARATRDVLPGYAFTPDGKALIAGYGGKLHRVELPSGVDTTIPFRADIELDVVSRLNFPQRLEQGAVKARIAQRPALSPDGKRIAWSALGRIQVSGLDGKATALGAGYQPAWSPDGQWIAFVTWNARSGGQIVRVRADGSGKAERLTTVPAFYHEPVWSPDGGRIVALRSTRLERLENGPAAKDELVQLPSSGGEVTRIGAADGVSEPQFTNDGARVFTFSREQGLVSMRMDGGERLGVMKLPQAASVKISPDGKRVLAIVNDQVYVLPTGGALKDGKRISRFGSDSCAWSASREITWALGSSLFTENREIHLDVQTARRIPEGTIVLRGARVITMRGNEVLENADVLVSGNRVVAVGAKGQTPSNARSIDVGGMTIIPGLVDIHGHFTDAPRNVLDVDANPYAANLAYGVTSVRDPQSATNDIFVYSDLVESGAMLGPRIFSTGPGVFATTNFQSFEDALDTVSRYRNYYGTNLLKSYEVGNRQQRQWVIEACRRLGMMPTTEGGAQFDMDLTHAFDGFSGNEHALPTAPIYRDVIEFYARTGITYTPTLLVSFGGPFALYDYLEREEPAHDAKLRRFLSDSYVYNKTTSRMLWFPPEAYHYVDIARGAAAIAQAGGHVAVGGHGELQGLQAHWEMWSLAKGGMSNLEVLRSATLHGAEAIGYAQDLGSIEVGKMADLVVLKKNPLENIRNTNTIAYVMKNGELFDGDTLDEVWPEKKARAQPWWR